MSKIQKASKVWTGAVAYVSLLVGAGLSIAGNLADTVRLRTSALDEVDIALAIGAPLASLLVAEMFVSAWPRTWSIQSIRWVATLAVGALAMIVSWAHIHALLVARGQEPVVAILWPLAIDGLAIMAMAKILVTRGHGQLAKPEPVAKERVTVDTILANKDAATLAKWNEEVLATDGQDQRVATQVDNMVAMANLPDLASPVSGQDGQDMETLRFGQKAMPPWVAELDEWQKGGHADPVATQPLPPDYAATLAKDVDEWPAEAAKVPADVREWLLAWDPAASDLKPAEVDLLIGTMKGRSTRVARRWRSAILGGQVSGPPA